MNLTDNDIIKALECHIKRHCWNDCPNATEERQLLGRPCSQMLAEDALDLINRKTAEIDRLRYILVNFMGEIFDWGNKNGVDTRIFAQTAILGKEKDGAVKQIKSEAYKEFAERLKQSAFDCDVSFGYGKEHYTEAVAVVEIDNLVKEMAGE